MNKYIFVMGLVDSINLFFHLTGFGDIKPYSVSSSHIVCNGTFIWGVE